MWNSLIITAYYPNFSESFKSFIRNNCTKSMEGEDAAQYHIDYVDEAAVMADSEATEYDLLIIKAAQEQNVEYFEF